VEFIDDLLPETDPYWTEGAGEAAGCWANVDVPGLGGSDAAPLVSSSVADARYAACYNYFGPAATADAHYTRDFPVLRATDNALTIGRFAWQPNLPGNNAELTTNRTIVGADPSNAPFLNFAACCFHHAASFKVRAGGEWVVNGQQSLGLLHHIVPEPGTGACVLDCTDPTRELLNGRAIEMPAPGCAALGQSSATGMVIDRNNPLAMRNPMYSFVMWSACASPPPGNSTAPQRDLQWRFSLRGGFNPLTINLAGTSGTTVSPQSMLAVGPFGQLAIVDGSSEGLIMIDLNTLAFARPSYY
jgi:hypothetical protein